MVFEVQTLRGAVHHFQYSQVDRAIEECLFILTDHSTKTIQSVSRCQVFESVWPPLYSSPDFQRLAGQESHLRLPSGSFLIHISLPVSTLSTSPKTYLLHQIFRRGILMLCTCCEFESWPKSITAGYQKQSPTLIPLWLMQMKMGVSWSNPWTSLSSPLSFPTHPHTWFR